MLLLDFATYPSKRGGDQLAYSICYGFQRKRKASSGCLQFRRTFLVFLFFLCLGSILAFRQPIAEYLAKLDHHLHSAENLQEALECIFESFVFDDGIY